MSETATGNTGILKCDSCGQYHADNEENLSASCECSRFLQRCDWATLEDFRADHAKLADQQRLIDEQRKALETARHLLADLLFVGNNQPAVDCIEAIDALLARSKRREGK